MKQSKVEGHICLLVMQFKGQDKDMGIVDPPYLLTAAKKKKK